MTNDLREAANPASLSLPSSPPAAAHSRRRSVLVGLTLAALLTSLAFLIRQSSFYQERMLARSSLAALTRIAASRRDDPTFLYYLGLRLNQQQRFTDADPVLRRAVGLDPDSARLRDEWTRALLGSGLTTAAFGQLTEFAGTHPRSAPAHFLLGKFYLAQNSMRRADEELEQAVTLDPGSAEAWTCLAQAADSLALATRARQAAERAVMLQPKNAGYHAMLAGLLAVDNQQAAAQREYETAVNLAPGIAALHREYAIFLLGTAIDASQWRRAEGEARQAVALDGTDPGAFLALGRILAGAGRQAEAVAPLLQAATAAPDDPASALALLQVQRALGRKAEAKVWEQAYLQRQRYAANRRALRDAILAAPNAAAPHARLARLLGQHGDVAGCVRHRAMALRCALDAPPALMAAARDLLAGGHVAEALPLAQRAAKIAKHGAPAHEVLGDTLLALNRYKEAVAEYQEALAWAPDREGILRGRLKRYLAAQAARPTPALLAYRQARRLFDNQVGLQRVTLRAESLAQRAVTLEPSNPVYLRLLLHMQFASKKEAAAVQTGRQLLAVAPRDAATHALLAAAMAERATQPQEFQEIERHLQAASQSPQTEATRRYVRGLLALNRRDGVRAGQELRKAAALDPSADVTFYKIALAEQMAGHPIQAKQALAQFQQRQAVKRQEASLQGDVRQHLDRPQYYLRLAQFYRDRGRQLEANAILAEVHRRFSPDVLRRAQQ